jgi:hypothetical protein
MPSLVSKKSIVKAQSINHYTEPVESEPTVSPTTTELPAPSLFEYTLFHPELYDDFSDVIMIGGREYKRTHANGICITREKELAEYLIKKEYQILQKKEI